MKVKNGILLLLIVFLAIRIFLGDDTVQKYETVESIELDNISSVMYSDDVYTIVTKDEKIVEYVPTDSYQFRQSLFENGIEVEEASVKRSASFVEKVLKFTACVIGLLIFNFLVNIIFDIISISRVLNGGRVNKSTKGTEEKENPFNFERMMPHGGMALNIKRDVPKIKFADVAGIDEVEREVKSVVSFLKNPYKYQSMGARMPKGAILYGPPGTGKTLIAKAIAGEAGVPFLNVSGSDFMEMYVGVGAKRVRELFETARKMAPCIIFIDEIDAIGGKRGRDNSSERDQTINAILTEMDGFSESEGIFVLAATNRLDILDPAIIRAGRFDKHIAVSLPDLVARKKILQLHAKNKKFDETVNLDIVAKQTVGFAGAALENLLNEAAIISVDNSKSFISADEIDRAFFKVVMQGDVKDGQDKRGSKELELVAWHEAGHALITKLLTNDDVTRVTILASTSGAGGVTFHTPKEGEFYSKQDLKNRIAISYGGRAAEEILFGNKDSVTVGASSDIQHASEAIKDYIMKYGMSEKFGMLDISAFDYQSMSNTEIVEEARNLANEIYEYTLSTLKNNKDKLKELAEELLEKESLLDTEIDEILGLNRNEIEESVATECC